MNQMKDRLKRLKDRLKTCPPWRVSILQETIKDLERYLNGRNY